jgi:sulfonate transport system substrate-binding protein
MMGRSATGIVCVAVSLFTPAQSLAVDQPREIRIGVASTGTGGRAATGGSFAAIAADRRALEEEFANDGIKVRYTYFVGAGPSVNESLASGQIDFALQGDLPALVARAGGLRTKIILAVDRFGAIFIAVPASSSARTLEDLKGKRVAVFKGTNLQLAFYNLLSSRGLKDSDFRIISMSTFDGDAALASGDIDAQVSYNDLVPLVDSGKARFVYSTHGDRKLGRLSHLLVTEDFAARYPDIVQRTVTALLKAADWEADGKNREAVYRIWAKSGLPASAWKVEYDDYDLRDRSSPLLDDFYREQYKRLLRSAQELKLVRKSFDIDTWLDSTFLERGLETLHLKGRWRNLDGNGRPRE